MKNRNFWAYYPLVLVLINVAFLIPAFLQFDKLEMAGIPVLLNIYAIFSALPFVIILLIWPQKTLKIISGIVASLIFLPIIFMLLFLEVGAPILSDKYEEDTAQKVTELNTKAFIPIGLDENNDVLLPDNILVRLTKLDSNFITLYGFANVFKKEIIEKQQLLILSTGSRPYTIMFTADGKDALLEKGKEYRLIEGDLKIGNQSIDKNWLWQKLDKNTTETISGRFTRAPVRSTKGKDVIELYFLPDNSNHEESIIITDLSKCFDNKNHEVGCYIQVGTNDPDWNSILYSGNSKVKVVKKDNDIYLLKANFLGEKLF